MRFCKECNNILHPKENRTTRTLFYACNRCAYREEAGQSCVYENNLVKTTELKLDIVHEDVVNDPTLQRSKHQICDRCNYSEAVFFQADDSAKSSSLSLIFVCTHCGKKWVG
ncbi:hypothetical protein JKP88DRAFT_260688 [Tribonema minus]|uniref:DNA-directed RNA polymerase subunit n=1 Tax=Tribonema minus TaxID=303371 RepID=A0A835YYP5_9STRA|nr:hypothetical protein JKP88DRAFT_260688 [Tribonema minus]